jgi:aminomethyltransferase
MIDVTETWGQIAVQGPKAKESLEELLGIGESLKYFGFGVVDYDDDDIIVAATGYTGEQGYELYGEPEALMEIWEDLIEGYEAKPCGLGSRDLLRLEAGYCLHGNDIDAKTTPYEAGLDWVTKLDKEDFIGKSAASRRDKKLVGIAFPEAEKLIPRAHTKILDLAGKEIGEVTSGNFSQMLNRAIALAYIKPDYQDSKVKVVIRNKEAEAQVGEAWFYRNIRGQETQDFSKELVSG